MNTQVLKIEARLEDGATTWHKRDVRYLLAQLKDGERELKAVRPLLRRLRTAHVGKRGYCEGCRASWPCMDAVDIDRILKGGD